MGPSRGSALIQRTAAGTLSRSGMRLSAFFWSSAVTPGQAFLGQPLRHSAGTKLRRFSFRLVSRSQSSHGVASMSFQRRARGATRSG